MSVEITADQPRIGDAAGPEVMEAMAAAESVLSRRFGAAIRLADPEELDGAGRSVVVRVRVAATPFSMPRTLVVKRYPPAVGDRDPFAHEAVSHQLLTALPVEDRPAPEMLAHDVGKRLVVLEDLGRAPRLSEKLLGTDARAAERGLLAWARAMGRLHATTAGREADFDALMRRQGVKCCQDPLASDIGAALARLPELLSSSLGVVTSEAAATQARQCGRRVETSRFRAFSSSTSCPDNNLVTSRGVRFLDFEGGCVRDVVFDAACLRVPFPSCWCAFALPPGMSEAMLAAWRAEVSSVWPELDDDAVLLPRLLDAQLLWVWVSTWRALPRMVDPITTDHQDIQAPPRSAVLAARWSRLGENAAALGMGEIADHADAVVAGLRGRYGAAATELPVYWAFRSPN